jgi:hypothetical protein
MDTFSYCQPALKGKGTEKPDRIPPVRPGTPRAA